MAIQNINELYDQLSSNENFSSFNFGSSDEFKSYLQELPEDKKQKFYNVWLQDQDVTKEQFDSLLKKKEPARTGILSSALGSIDLGSPSVSETEPQTVTPEVTPITEEGIEDFSVSGKGGPLAGPGKPAPFNWQTYLQDFSRQNPNFITTEDWSTGNIYKKVFEKAGFELSSKYGFKNAEELKRAATGITVPEALKTETQKTSAFRPASELKGRTFDISATDEQFAGQRKQIQEQTTKQAPLAKQKIEAAKIALQVEASEKREESFLFQERTQNPFSLTNFTIEIPTAGTQMDASGRITPIYQTVSFQPTDADIGEILFKNTKADIDKDIDIGRIFGLTTRTFNKENYIKYLETNGRTKEQIDQIINYYVDKYLESISEVDVEEKLAEIEGKDINEKLTKLRQQEDEKGLELLTKQYGPEVALKARELQALMAKRKRPGEAGYDQWSKQMQALQKEMSGLVGGGEQLYNPEDGKLYDAASAPERAVRFKGYLDNAIRLYGNTDIDKLKQIRSKLYDQVKALEKEYDRMVGPNWRGKEYLKNLAGYVKPEQYEAMVQAFGKLDQLKAKLSAVNSRILTNTNIEPEASYGTQQFIKGFKRGFVGGDFASRYTTQKDDYNAWIDAASGVIQTTPEQLKKGEETVTEQVMGSFGSTVPIMVELAVTRKISPSAAFLRSSGYLRPITRGVLKVTGNTKFANFMTDAIANAVQGYTSYGLTSETGMTGVGETFASQTLWDKVGLEKMGKQWAPLLRYLSKTAFGTTGETFEEFMGEFTNSLSNSGFNFEKSAEETFGKDLSEFGKKLAVYATSSALLSGVFNSPELFKRHLGIDKVITEAENKLKDPNLNQTDREAIESSLKMMKNTRDQLLKKETEIAEPVSTILPFSKPSEEMEAPGGVTPPPAEGAEAAAFEAGEGPLETAQPVGAQPVNAQEVNNQLAKEGINDVSLQRVEEYGKEIESGNVDFERFSPSEQRGLIEGGPIHVAATIITGKSDRAADTQDDSNDRQEEIIKEYAQKKGIWIENAPAKLKEKYGDPFQSGKESLVWLDEARGVVVKSSVTDQYPTLREALDGITLSNAYFPAAKITVVGFGTNEKGEFEIITEQPYIQGVNPTEQEIKEHFNKLGFTENERMYQGKDAFGNEEVIFKDAAPKNVIKTPEGNIIPIDLIAKINKPELNANGTRTVPSTVAEEVTEAAPEAVGPQVAQKAKPKGDYKKILKERMTKEELNTVRASLRKTIPDSYTLEILDAIAKNEYPSTGFYELDETIAQIQQDGLTFGALVNLAMEDEVLMDKKNLNSKRALTDYLLRVGQLGRLENLAYRAIEKEETAVEPTEVQPSTEAAPEAVGTQAVVDNKSSIKELFKSNSKLAEVGTEEQYSKYIDSIFPDTKVKDIVYHGSKTKKPTDIFVETFVGKNHKILGAGKGFYFTKDFNYSKIFGETTFSIINITNPTDFNSNDYDTTEELEAATRELSSKGDGVIDSRENFYYPKGEEKLKLSSSPDYIVFKPEQIHILGNQQDIEGFKEFVKKEEAVGAQKAEETTEGSLTKEIKKAILTDKEITETEKKVLNNLFSTENISLEKYRNIFFGYKMNDFNKINSLLRKGLAINKENLEKEGVAPAIAETIAEDYDDMAKVLSNTTFSPEEKITLYRSTNYLKTDGDKSQNLSDYEVGDKISDAAFVSTTIDPSRLDYEKKPLIKFELNPGDKINGTYLGGNEKEFLIDKNTEFVVKNKEIIDGNTVLTVGLPFKEEGIGAQPEVTEAAKAIEARPETVQQFEQKAKQVASTKENTAFVQNSVVKNADGTPLVVYNNTNESEARFTEGRPTGLFFTTNAEAFSDYGKTKFAAILNLKNPYYSSMSAVRSAADIQKLKDAGYDGVITHPSYKYDKYVSTLQDEVAAQEDYIKNQDKFNNVEGRDNRNELDLTKAYEFIAFNPEQIKIVESADNKSLSATEQVTQQAPEVTETEAKPQIIEFVENGKPVKVDLSKLQLVLEEEFIGEETKKTGELPSEGMFSFSIQSEGRKLGEIGVEFQKDNENMKIAYSKIFGTAEKELELDHRFVVRVLQKLKQFFKKSFKGNFIYDSNQGKGIGKKAYGVLAKAIKEEFGKNLISDTRRSEASEALWKSLERDGLAVNRGEYYEYILPTEEVGYGAQNKIVTKQDYDQAVKNLRNPNLPSGFDFSKIGELVKAAMYHIEAGSRKFADFTKKMVEQFGRGVKQYLPNVFRRANNQMQQQQVAAPTPAAAPAPTVKTSAQVKQDVTNNYNYIVSTNPNMTEDQIGQELVNRGFSLGEIKRFVPQLRNFWEKQAIDRFEKFVDDFKGKFQTRRNEIEDFMQRNPALDYAQVYDQLKGEYSDFELFKMFYEDGLDGDVLDNLFGTEYRQTIQRAIESKNYNPDFLRDLDKDIKSRKTLNNLGESRSLFAELQDFATAEQLLSAAAEVLGLSGIEEAMKTMTDELRAENQQKKLILETYGQIIQGNVTEDNVKLMSEMLSFSGRMLRMGRGLFMTEKGLADLIIKNLETIEIKQSTIFSKKKRAFRVSEGNKKKIQDGVKKYFETKGELDVATKALQEGVDSFTEDTFGNFDKAKENHQRATQDLKGLINRLYGSRQPMFSKFFTSRTSLGLLRFATAAIGLVGNLENMFANMPRRGVGKLLGWTRVLADKIAGAGVYYRLKTGKTPLAAEALKRGTGVGIDPALYRSLAYQEGIRQIKDILFKGLSETSTSKNNFLEGYAEIDGVKDFQLAFNMMKKLTMNFLNKEKFTEEEFATAFDKMLLALEEKDANGNPKLALMHSKGYYTASTLMRGIFGAIPTITGRAIALSGDRYFYKLGFYEFLAAYANSKGITDPKEVGQFIRLHSIGDSDLTKAAEEAGNRRIFAQNNKLVKFNAAAIGSLEKKESSIFGTKIKKKIEGKGFQAKAQNIIAAPVVGTRILLNSFAPFVRIPSNAIYKYLRVAFPPYTLFRAFMAQAMLSSEMNRYQENYGLDRNAEISETKKKKMEADRIKLFELQRMTAQYWTEFFQGSQLYVLAYLLVEAGAVGAPYGDDEESKKRARAAGIAQQDAGKINLSQLFRSLSGEDRGRTMQTGDVTFDYRNLGMLGFVISSMASIKGAYRTSKLEQKKMLGTEENMVNTIGAKMLVESLQNGITQLSFIQNISSLLSALKEGSFEKSGKDFVTNLITTTATVPTLSYGVFSPFDKTQGISADPFRNFNPDLEERDYFMGEVGARVWTKLTARSPLYGFGLRDENGEFVAPLKVLGLTPSKFYRPQIGPFGERLYKKSTFWDTRSGSKTDKFLAFIQASIDPFSFSDYEGFVSNVKPYNEKQKYKRGDYVEWNNNVWVVLRDGLQGISPKTANIAEYASENADYFLIDKKYDFMDPDQFRRDKQGSQKTKLLFDFVNLYEEAVGDRKPYAVFSKLYKDPVKFKDEDGEFAIYIPIDEQRKLSIMRGEAMSRVFDNQTVESYISAINKAADNENMTDSEYKEYVKDIFKTYFLGPIDNENNRRGGLVDKVNEAISKVENKPEYVRIVRDGIVKSIEEGNLTKDEFDRLKKIPEAAGFVNELNEKKLKFRN